MLGERQACRVRTFCTLHIKISPKSRGQQSHVYRRPNTVSSRVPQTSDSFLTRRRTSFDFVSVKWWPSCCQRPNLQMGAVDSSMVSSCSRPRVKMSPYGWSLMKERFVFQCGTRSINIPLLLRSLLLLHLRCASSFDTRLYASSAGQQCSFRLTDQYGRLPRTTLH